MHKMKHTVNTDTGMVHSIKVRIHPNIARENCPMDTLSGEVYILYIHLEA